MKKYFYIVFAILHYSVSAQKYDSKWLLGYWADGSGIPYGINELSFSNSTVQLSWKNHKINFATTNTALFDSSGEVLFYTNGVSIWNGDNDTMINGKGLSPSNYTNSMADHGLNIAQGVIAVPSPRKKGEYYLFHETLKWTDSYGERPLEVYYSTIDINLANDLGAVTSKNNMIIVDTLDAGQITACKHANGRDWWILVPLLSGEGYYRLFLSPSGVQNLGIQITGDYHPTACSSQAVFSPDGTKYARYDQGDWTDTLGFLNVFDFDRCTGLLSNKRIDTIPHLSNFWGAAGIAISPNSKVVYVNDTYHMYQYDMTATDLAASKYLIGTYDGYQSPFGSTFYQGQLAPDGKIYWSCTYGEDVLHVIDYPDSLGAACSFRQHGIQLLSYNAFGLPNHPNYYLGALVGSGCDTITTTQLITNNLQVHVYPNPTYHYLSIEVPNLQEEVTFCVENIFGQMIHKQIINTKNINIDVSNFASGVYIYKMSNANSYISGKFVKH